MVVRALSLFPGQAKMSSFLKRKRKKMTAAKNGASINSPVIDKSPAISMFCIAKDISLPDLRHMCDFCMEPLKPGGPMVVGRAVTYVNADVDDYLKDMAELALKFYNDNKLKSFKLVKVCKSNRVGAGYYGLTFRAKEYGSEECPVFRGGVHVVGGKKALFCEIKDDDEITLLPGDDDYVSSGQACESED